MQVRGLLMLIEAVIPCSSKKSVESNEFSDSKLSGQSLLVFYLLA